MRRAEEAGNLTPKIVSLHEMLESIGVPHQFGGAIALAWYRNPRATTDIDVNLTVPPEAAEPILGALAQLGVTVTRDDRATLAPDGRARLARFGPVEIPILAPEHLIVCKAVFDRPKDWLDIDEMVRWGTEIDASLALGWVADILGPGAPQYARLADLLAPAPDAAPSRLGDWDAAPSSP